MTNDTNDHRSNHPIHITVRTMAGHTRKETAKPDDTIADITDDAVKHFTKHGQLTPGAYALTILRAGNNSELDPTSTLRDAGIVDGDLLVLVNREPQIDG